MHRGLAVAVVVPAYGEARLLPRMLRRLPAWVDAVYVVDDASDDGTAEAALAVGDPRLRVVRHSVNRGVGAAIATGYAAALAAPADVVAVMAGDDQMDPGDLPSLLAPLADGRADHVKGDRLAHPEARRMPLARRAGTRFLAGVTRAATGLRVHDSQCGYTATTAACLRALPLDDLWPRYGYPNDLLALLARGGFRVAEVPVRPVYADEASGLRPWHVVTILAVIARRWGAGRAPGRPRRAGAPAGARFGRSPLAE
ncbi:MAG: glycosyltransferase family 2 protein [Polyangiaceae bacterium]|nr:glycosyltransferase family 2 protein [Polyangiaceae bacterium]